MKGRTVEEVIRSISEGCGAKEKIDLNEEMQSEMLLVLDGFDEVGGDSRKDVLKSLYSLKLSSMTIIVTCRSGIFPLASEEIEELNPDVPQRNAIFYQKKVTIEGIEKNNRKIFLTKFCSKSNAKAVITLLKDLQTETANMLQSPLLLLQMSYFVDRKMDVDTKSNLTNLYKSLFNNIAKCNLERNEKWMGRNRPTKKSSQLFDLFDVSDETSRHYQEMLEKFGELCLIRLQENNYSFEEDELILNIYQMGFLIRQKIVGMWEADEHFECFHLSFMEFCAVYSIWRKFQINPTGHNFDIEKFSELMENRTLLGVFLFGLIQEKVFDIDWSKLLFFTKQYRWKFVAELKRNATMAKLFAESFSEIVIRSIHFNEELFRSQFFVDIVKNIIELHKEHRICIPFCLIGILPSSKLIADLTLDIDLNTAILDEQFSTLSKIVCSELNLYIHGSVQSIEEEPNFGRILNSILCNKVVENSLTIDIEHTVSISLVEYCLQQGIMKQTMFNDIVLEGDIDKYENVVCKLMEENRVYTIVVEQSREKDLTDFLKAAVESQSLKILQLTNSSPKKIDIDVHSIVKKDWEFLKLSSYNLHCCTCGFDENSLTNAIDKSDIPLNKRPCWELIQNGCFRSASYASYTPDWLQQKPEITVTFG